MTLVLTEKQCGREGIVIASLRDLCCRLQPPLVADPAPVALSKGNTPEKLLQGILIEVYDRECPRLRQLINRILPIEPFPVRVDIRIKKKASHLVTFFSQGFQWIACAIGAAYVEKDPHAFSGKRGFCLEEG